MLQFWCTNSARFSLENRQYTVASLMAGRSIITTAVRVAAAARIVAASARVAVARA